jgi:WXG100 family type VII secretion target
MDERIGGTPEQMTSLGTQFDTEAQTLHTLVARITTQMNSTDWQGGAARRYREQWETDFKGVFTKVEVGLHACAKEVRHRATLLTHAGA